MRSIELCKNLEHAPAVVRARDAVLERRAAGRHAAYLVARRGWTMARMLPRTRKAPTGASPEGARALVKAHPAGLCAAGILKNDPRGDHHGTTEISLA